jgi:ABC-type transporter Mla subunit MlaD
MSLPRLSDVVDLAVSAAGKAAGTAAAVVALPGRVVRLIDGTELLLARATATLDAAQRAIDEATAITRTAAGTSAAAAAVVTQAARTAGTAEELIGAYEPAARRFVDHLSPEEVDAAIQLIDELPRLAHHLNTDVMPILATLDRVGPDIHELLNVTRDLRQAIVGIPGFAMLRRRGAAGEAPAEAGGVIP